MVLLGGGFLLILCITVGVCWVIRERCRRSKALPMPRDLASRVGQLRAEGVCTGPRKAFNTEDEGGAVEAAKQPESLEVDSIGLRVGEHHGREAAGQELDLMPVHVPVGARGLVSVRAGAYSELEDASRVFGSGSGLLRHIPNLCRSRSEGSEPSINAPSLSPPWANGDVRIIWDGEPFQVRKMSAEL